LINVGLCECAALIAFLDEAWQCSFEH
jgi:hypothetical protein